MDRDRAITPLLMEVSRKDEAPTAGKGFPSAGEIPLSAIRVRSFQTSVSIGFIGLVVKYGLLNRRTNTGRIEEERSQRRRCSFGENTLVNMIERKTGS